MLKKMAAHSYQHLQEYVAKHGDALVPKKHKTADGFGLGAWVLTQRKLLGGSSYDKIGRLESVSGWVWDVDQYRWDQAFKHLEHYEAAHKNCLVPAQYRTPDGFILGAWVAKQKKNKPNLSELRRTQLDTLSSWTWIKN
jgi:hypothetical protein